MNIERIKRWQWIAISLVLGAIIAGVQMMYGRDVDISNSMTSARMFESAIQTEVKGSSNAKSMQFKNLVVYPNPNPIPHETTQRRPTRKDKNAATKAAAPERTYYIVKGRYYSGIPTRQSDGKSLAVFKSTFFVETAEVYTPTTNLAALNKPGGPDYVKRWKAIPKPTVLDFLEIMKEARGIDYTYAWWAEPGKGTVLWMGLSFVVIGLIWPSVVSLLTYGTLMPPVEEKGTDLSKVKASTSAPAMKRAEATEEDMDELKRMEEALKAKIAASDAGSPAARAAGPAAPAAIKQLTATTSEKTAVEETKEQKAFGAKADDFYPTERTGGKPKPEQKHG